MESQHISKESGVKGTHSSPPYGKPDTIGVRFQRYSATADFKQNLHGKEWRRKSARNGKEGTSLMVCGTWGQCSKKLNDNLLKELKRTCLFGFGFGRNQILHADDTVLMATNKEDLQTLLKHRMELDKKNKKCHGCYAEERWSTASNHSNWLHETGKRRVSGNYIQMKRKGYRKSPSE